jgi:hypothetical protein
LWDDTDYLISQYPSLQVFYVPVDYFSYEAKSQRIISHTKSRIFMEAVMQSRLILIEERVKTMEKVRCY